MVTLQTVEFVHMSPDDDHVGMTPIISKFPENHAFLTVTSTSIYRS